MFYVSLCDGHINYISEPLKKDLSPQILANMRDATQVAEELVGKFSERFSSILFCSACIAALGPPSKLASAKLRMWYQNSRAQSLRWEN